MSISSHCQWEVVSLLTFSCDHALYWFISFSFSLSLSWFSMAGYRVTKILSTFFSVCNYYNSRTWNLSKIPTHLSSLTLSTCPTLYTNLFYSLFRPRCPDPKHRLYFLYNYFTFWRKETLKLTEELQIQRTFSLNDFRVSCWPDALSPQKTFIHVSY